MADYRTVAKSEKHSKEQKSEREKNQAYERETVTKQTINVGSVQSSKTVTNNNLFQKTIYDDIFPRIHFFRSSSSSFCYCYMLWGKCCR